MSDLKTRPNDRSVEEFLGVIEDEAKRQDCHRIVEIMQEVTGEPPRMWGDSIVGFGSYHFKYASGREGDWFLAGFSPRKQNLTLYIMTGFDGEETLLGRLGKYTTGKACLYIKKLADVDQAVLKELVTRSVRHMAGRSG